MKNLLRAKSLFREKGIYAIANANGNFAQYANEEIIMATIQKPLIECGLELSNRVDFLDDGREFLEISLSHIDSGEVETSRKILPNIALPTTGKIDYLKLDMEKAKVYTYWTRILYLRMLGIPAMDANSNSNTPQNLDQQEPMQNPIIADAKKRIANTPNPRKTESFFIGKIGKDFNVNIDSLDYINEEQAEFIINFMDAQKEKQNSPQDKKPIRTKLNLNGN